MDFTSTAEYFFFYFSALLHCRDLILLWSRAIFKGCSWIPCFFVSTSKMEWIFMESIKLKKKKKSYHLHLLHHSSVCPWKNSQRGLTPVIVHTGWKNDGKRTREMERDEEVTCLPQKARDKALAEHHGTRVPCPTAHPEVTPAAYLSRWQDPVCDSGISPRGGGGRWSQVWGSIQAPVAHGGRCGCCDRRRLLGGTEAISREWHSALIYVNKFINSASTAPSETSEAITDAGGEYT